MQTQAHQAPDMYKLACHTLLTTPIIDRYRGCALLKDFLRKGDWFPFSKTMTAQIHRSDYETVSELWLSWEAVGALQTRDVGGKRERRINPKWVAELLFTAQATDGLRLPKDLLQWCAEEIAEGVL